jgi:hypothetical protein
MSWTQVNQSVVLLDLHRKLNPESLPSLKGQRHLSGGALAATIGSNLDNNLFWVMIPRKRNVLNSAAETEASVIPQTKLCGLPS